MYNWDNIQLILEKHNIKISLAGNIKNVIQNMYNSILSANDLLTDDEHILMFKTCWYYANDATKEKIAQSEKLIRKLIMFRKQIESFGKLASGSIDENFVVNLVRICRLENDEELILWLILSKLQPDYPVFYRDSDYVNEILNLYPIIEHKLKWFGKINVLDVGCGKYGICISNLKVRYNNKINGYGIDADISKKHPSFVHLSISDIKHIPFPENYFDIAYSCSVFEHYGVETHLVFINEVLRVLKSKGIFLFDGASHINEYKWRPSRYTDYKTKVIPHQGGYWKTPNILIYKY